MGEAVEFHPQLIIASWREILSQIQEYRDEQIRKSNGQNALDQAKGCGTWPLAEGGA